MSVPSDLFRLVDVMAHWAETTPDATAVVGGETRLTYCELAERVDRAALALLASGIGKGDRVAVLAPPSADFLLLLLASLKVGAVWMGLNPKYRLEELAHVVGDARPTLVFARSAIEGRSYAAELADLQQRFDIRELVWLGGDSADGTSIGQFLERADPDLSGILEQAAAAVEPRDAALIVYTSGTTGKPKGALLPHLGLVKCSRTQWSRWPHSPLRMINNLPINHIGCVGDICAYVLFGGGTIVFMEKFEPERIPEVIEQEKITVWGQIPTMHQLTIDSEAFARHDLSSLKAIMWSGAAAPRELIQRLAAMGVALASNYGMTETVGSVTFTDADADLETLATTIGRPCSEYQVRLADPDGQPVTQGSSGEVQVKGDFILLGYLNQPEATAAGFTADGWFKTGDLAIEDADGNYQLVGRLKEMFKSGGYNVYPREIELALESHPDVAMAAVIGLKDEVYGEVGHAFVLPRAGGDADEEELKAWCRERLANYKIPKSFRISANLPLLPIGKIDKDALRRLAG